MTRRRVTVDAAKLPVLAFQRGKYLPAPPTDNIFPRLRHCFQIALSAAIAPAVPVVRAKFFAAADALFLSRFVYSIGFMVFFPPLQPTGITAKPAIGAHSPIHGKLFTAVRTNLRRALYTVPSFPLFLAVIYNTAAVAAKSPPFAPLAGLFDVLATFRAGIHRDGVISFRVVIFDTAFSAAVFLPSLVTAWLERLPAAQAG